MALPHFVDQYIWDKIISEYGVRPKGIKVSRMTKKNPESIVLELLNNRSFKEKSEKIGNQMNKEDFKEELYNSIKE
jgi:UDP:flavonoid glycosyltransferase YjiC (YdhE family)